MSMAAKYGMKKRQAMYDGGTATTPPAPSDAAKKAAESMRKAFRFASGGAVSSCEACKGGQCMAHGGMVDRIMAKRMSEGGVVANDTEDVVAGEPAEFDELVLSGGLEDDSGAGNEIGNATVADEDQSLVGRIMRSRAKKDRLPRPA